MGPAIIVMMIASQKEDDNIIFVLAIKNMNIFPK
jgi:hypothetical protein